MTAVKDFVPDVLTDDPNYDYQLTSHLDQEDLKDARALAEANIATAGSSVPQASTLRAGNTTPRETPATELSDRVDDDLQVKRLDLSPSTLTVAVGATSPAITKLVTPSWATTKTVTFASSATGVATVNSSTGVVTGVAEGTATITGTTTDQSKTDTVVVTVVAA